MKKLVKWGGGVGLLLPAFICSQHRYFPGTEVKIVVLEREIRIRHASLPLEDEDTAFGQVPAKTAVDDPW